MTTAEIIRQLLDYNPVTGVFIWLRRQETDQYVKTWNTRFAGKIAGRISVYGYREIVIDGVLHRANRLAWIYMTGEWPTLNVDHENTDRADNRWENLREATIAQNAWNVSSRKKNSFGLSGVGYHRNCRSRPYSSRITVNGKLIHLGYFATPESAHSAYMEAVNKYHGEFARAA